MAFANLHVHSQFSLLSGMCRITPTLALIKERGETSLAVTDPNLFASLIFYKEATGAKINPIMGLELTPGGRRGHLVLLAQNNEGWAALRRLSSAVMTYIPPKVGRGKKKVPPPVFLPPEEVARGLEGVYVLTGGVTGDLYREFQAEGIAGLRALLRSYKELFGAALYVELTPAMKDWNQLARVADEEDVDAVVTNDAYYLTPDEVGAWEVLKTVAGRGRCAPPAPGLPSHHHLRTEEELRKHFRGAAKAVTMAATLASRCKVKMELGKPRLPVYPVPGGDTHAYFLQVAREGLEKLFEGDLQGVDQAQYRARLEMELAVITKMDFPGYFLIVWDFIRAAKARGIPVGPGRGSGAGSLVAYALSITDLDPIAYNLMFERFLNPERVSMPDFDIDFCKRRRPEVISYLQERYGVASVGRIATFKPLNGKTVLKDVGRAFGLSFGMMNDLTSKIPQLVEGHAPTISWILEHDQRLKNMCDENPLVAATLKYSEALEGLMRDTSVHASGVVIAEGPLANHVPAMRDKEGELCAQLTMVELEDAGLIKFDLLGLTTMTLLDLVRKMLAARGVKIDLKKIPLDDKGVFGMFQAADTMGVFQMVKPGFKKMLLEMKPDCFEDVISCGALYRPGPLKGGMVSDFIKRKHGEQEVVYLHPELEAATKNTYGILVYQEQPMAVARVLAGYTLGGADLLRRAMGKKKKEVMEKEEAKFLAGCAKVGKCSRETAKKIFDLMSFFAGYGFNRAHSAAYGLISYYTAYLKHHYPQEFYAAHLSVQADEEDKSEKIAEAAFELRREKVEILAPDLNRSARDFLPEGKGVRYGFSGIKGFGDAAAYALLAERERGGPFSSLVDLMRRVPKMGAKAVTALIHSGGCDSILAKGEDGTAARETAAAYVPVLADFLARRAKHAPPPQQQSLFDLMAPAARPPEPEPPPPAPVSPDVVARLAAEKRTLGFYFSSHPVLAVRHLAKEKGAVSLKRVLQGTADERYKVVALVAQTFEKATQKEEWMAILTLEDPGRRAEAVCFPRTYASSFPLLEAAPGQPLLFTISASGVGSKRKLIIDAVDLLKKEPSKPMDEGPPVNNFVALDIETASLGEGAPGKTVDPSQFRVVEVGAAIFSGREHVRNVSRLVNPLIPIDKGSQAVHKITDEMVRDAKTFDQVAPDLAKALKGKIILVYNGLRFDVPVLNDSFVRAGLDFRIQPEQVVDLYPYIRAKYPGMTRRPKGKQLENQADFFGVRIPAAHRAADDSEATGRVFLAMQARGLVPRGLTALLACQ